MGCMVHVCIESMGLVQQLVSVRVTLSSLNLEEFKQV